MARSASSRGLKSVFFCWARHLDTQFRVAVSVRLRMLESLASRVERVVEVAFSISRRIVRFGVQRGRRMVVDVCCRRWRMVVRVWRDGRWVRSGGVFRFSCEAAWSEALVAVRVYYLLVDEGEHLRV